MKIFNLTTLKKNEIFKISSGIICLIIFTIILFLPEPQEQIQNNYDYKKCMPEKIEEYENSDIIKYSFSHNSMLYMYYINIGRYQDAIRTIDTYKKEDFYPTCYRYQSNRVRFLCKTKIKIINMLFGDGINTNDIKHSFKANAYYKLGDIKNAKKELSLNKEYSTLSDKVKFKIYLEEKNFEEAKKIIEMKHSYDKKIYTAELYSAQKEYKKAERLYKELINNLPKRDDIKISYAVMLIKQDKYLKAIKILTEIKDDKYFYTVNYNLGLCYKKTGNNKQAKHYFKKVLSKNPDNKILIEYLATGELKPFNR